MHQLRKAGSSDEAIPQYLHQVGVPTAPGGPWQAMVVWGIVKRTQPQAGRKMA